MVIFKTTIKNKKKHQFENAHTAENQLVLKVTKLLNTFTFMHLSYASLLSDKWCI